MTREQVIVFARGVSIGLFGGALFYAMSLPLPWVMGAMLATILAGAVGKPSYMPRSVRNAVIPALGVMFGSAIDRQAMAHVPELWLLLPMTLAYLAIIVGAGTAFFMRIGGLDLPTAYFASVPGSFSEMIYVAEDRGADLGAVAIVHAIRLVVSLTLITIGFRTILDIDTTNLPSSGAAPPGLVDVVLLCLCAVVGFLGGRAVRLPSAHLFGPLILSAAAHLTGLVEGAPPGWTVSVAQVFIGIFIGLRFAGMRLDKIRRLMTFAVGWTLFLLIAALLVSEVSVLILGLPFEAAFLSFAPGGAVEISVVALAAGVSLSLVTITQFIRISMTVLLAPLIFRLLARFAQQD